MNRQRSTALGMALLISLFLASCASSGRLWRMSPLNNDASANRLSLWPIVYHSGAGTSVLWPIFDVDDKGFALRPLVANDESKWELLYPWAFYNSKTKNGWALPFYSFGSNSGLFPVANFGKFSYVGLIWWKRDGAGALKSGGLFPLVHFGDTNYVGPAYWTPKGGGLFPLMHFGGFNYVGPAWWNRSSGAFGLLPLFGTGSVRHVGPLWWKKKIAAGYSAGLFPLLWFDDTGGDFWLLPFYGHSLSPESRSRNYLLGIVHTGETKTARENWVLPFYFNRKTPSAADTLLLPFFWKRTREGKSQVFTLLGNRSVDPASKTFNLYPFWWSNESKDSSWNMLLPFFYYASKGDERTLLTPLGGRGWSHSGATRYFNAFGPLFHHSRSADGDDERTAVLWPLFERHRAGDETTTRAAPFFSSTSSPGGSEGWYGLGLGHFERRQSAWSHRLWPLYAVSERERGPGFLYDFTLYGSRKHEGTTQRHLFPLFASETSAAASDMRFLMGLGGYSTSKNDTSWYLWPLVAHSENENDSMLVHWTTLFGNRHWLGHASWHVGGPFLYASTADEANGVQSTSRRLFLFFTDEKWDSADNLIPAGTRAAGGNLVHRSEQAFLFGAFKREHNEYRVWRAGVLTSEEDRVLSAFSSRYDDVPQMPRDEARARAILADRGRAPVEENTPALKQAIAAFADSSTEIVERDEIRAPLLFDYESEGKKVEWNGPLWLISSKDEPGHSKFSLLYYGYRSETKGDETRRDIFPFITYDTSPRGANVSFLWHLLHYRSENGKRGGHVLFIPWGDT